MNRVDVPALIAYGAGGGFAGIFTALGFMFPSHQSQLTGAAAAVLALCGSVAGIVRVITNPSAPAGSVSANIPIGSMPVVAPQDDATRGQNVAVVQAMSVSHVTSATSSPPAQQPGKGT